MTKHTVVLLAMLAIAGTALAQTPPSPPPQGQAHREWKNSAEWHQKMEKWRMERLTVLLDLTPAQRQQMQSIFDDGHAKMKSAMQQVEQAMKQARAAHHAVRKETEQKLAAVLTPTQMRKLKLLMPEHGPAHFMMRRKGMGPIPPPPPRADPGAGADPQS
ncbi:MAG TPA: Spy/CpxP family protein refolding chaperone [Steroidobacteraceae bacterium]|jgi:hypothetical protein